MLFDDQNGFGLLWDEVVEAGFDFTRQAEESPVQQIARRGLVRQNVAHGPRGRFQAVEQQQGHAAISRQRLRGQRGFGRKRKRAFAADKQTDQIEIIFARFVLAQHAVEMVAATVDGAVHPCGLDQISILSKQLGKAIDKIAFDGIGVFALAAEKRFARGLDAMPVG